ncbi:beta strand repeat-containing protein, partial [Acinetobacter sp. ULE_I010]|uniref:beta strand repeat-containing protein n=1 Tax=Acinetobacter sp. ULE_I010 TaxID=3373065 RepID=UPI003AF4E55C
MNKIYKVIWNTQLGCWQAVSELAKNHTSSQTTSTVKSSITGIVQRVSALLLFGMAMLPLSIHAAISNTELPTGAQINSGSATFNQTGNTLNINQNSQNLSTNWNTFNIGQDATVNFNQQNKSSVAINHVKDSNASQIMGRLNANGQVFLLNPNGVVFSKTAQVNVGGLVASTLSLNDADIQNGKFTLKGDANSTATIENQGTINTLQGGTVALIAPNVKNTGTIKTPNGTTHLTSASQVTLALQNGSLTQYQVDQGVLQGLVDNGGAIIADNGAVLLTAKAKDSLSKAVVNHTGIIEANRLTQNAKGEIIILGDVKYGETNVSGTLKAEGKNGVDGGFIETSAAKVNIDQDIKVSTLSDTGKTGEWLIDPYNVVISNAVDTGTGFVANQDDTIINATTLTNALATTGVTVSTGGTAVGTQEGNITVDADLAWASNSTLTLQADKDIILNKKVTATSGGLTLNAANNISANDAINVGTFTLTKGNWLQNAPLLPSFYAKDFRLNGGSFIRALGGDGSAATPWKLTDIYGVQGMGTKLNGNFALANDIDASGTVNWNSGAGFNPIGNSSNAFTGAFDGLNHTVTGLTINRSTLEGVGLIGWGNNVKISNIGLVDSNIVGGRISGTLAGYLGYDSSIINSYTTGKLTVSSQHAGGILGAFENGTSELLNSYSTVSINGNSISSSIGGLIGTTNSATTISNSYYAGTIENGNNNVGGILGDSFNNNLININNSYVIGNVKGSAYTGAVVGGSSLASSLTNLNIQNSFFNIETTGQTQALGNNSGSLTNVVGLTTAQMFDKNNFSGFDFGSIWGNGNNQTTPYLLNLANNQVFNKNDLPTGTITSTNRPALYTAILNINQLQDMNKNLSGKYLLGNNIDASDTVNWNSGAGFNPIGNSSLAFSGVLDGLNHTVNGLTIYKPNTNNLGLFTRTTNTAYIKNIGLKNVAITGFDNLGGLVGYNLGSIFNAHTTGEIKSIDNTNYTNSGGIGGLVGYNGNEIKNSYSAVNVSSTLGTQANQGGLVGYNVGGNISNSFATGNVNSTSNLSDLGGLVGHNGGTISNSYATGNVTSGNTNSSYGLGGLVGFNSGGAISNSYASGVVTSTSNNTLTTGGLAGTSGSVVNSFWNQETTGQSTSAGGTGLTTAQMQNLDTFTGAGWDIDDAGGTGKVWRIYEGQTAPLLRSFLKALTITNDDTTTTYNGKNQGGGYQVVPVGTVYDPTLILSQQKNATPTAVNIDLNKDLYSVQQGYDLIVQGGSGTGTLKINPKDITVTANGGTSIYGDNPLNPNFSANGLVNGETASVLTGLNNSFGINNTSNAGSYTLAVDGTLTNGNYNITQRNDGTWTVGKKSIVVIANGGTSTYGDNPLNPNFIASGLANGETASVLTGLNNSFGISNTTNAGNHTLTVDGTLSNGNYNITQRTNGTWVVGKKDITVTANSGTSTYGDNPLNPNFSA